MLYYISINLKDDFYTYINYKIKKTKFTILNQKNLNITWKEQYKKILFCIYNDIGIGIGNSIGFFICI